MTSEGAAMKRRELLSLAATPLMARGASAHGIVSSAHRLASQAGGQNLRGGGNAFDAAVAVAATLNVVEPMMSGMGGYGVFLIYDAVARRYRFLDSTGRAPAGLNSDVFRAPTAGYFENRKFAKAVSTPGNGNGWEMLSKTYGKLAWRDLFAPAIRHAEEGFHISSLTAEHIAAEMPDFPSHARPIYSLKAGERLVQKDLSRSLKTLAAQGAKAIYGGAIGMAIDQEMRERGGFVTIDDLRNNRAEFFDALRIDYRGRTIVAPGPPT